MIVGVSSVNRSRDSRRAIDQLSHSDQAAIEHGADRVLIDVEDHCGGLLPSEPETMFLPFTQSGQNKTGLGLGLSLSRRSVEVNKGTLSVRYVPGSGCVFTIDLPRHSIAESATD
jgi:C4-dicarboxylate-specific signal transduction histidine kinase